MAALKMAALEPQLQQLKTQLNTPLVALVLLGFFSLLAVWSGWNSINSILHPPQSGDNSVYRAPTKVDLNQASQFHLLGADATNLGDLPLASLGVTLIGIFADNQNKSTALITLSGGQSKMYHVGDKLAPNVTIEKILTDSVVVQHNGRLEKLAMPIKPLTFSDNLPDSGLWR